MAENKDSIYISPINLSFFQEKNKQGQQTNWNQTHSTLNLTFSIWIKLSKLIPQILPDNTKTNENDTSVSLTHILGFATVNNHSLYTSLSK